MRNALRKLSNWWVISIATAILLLVIFNFLLPLFAPDFARWPIRLAFSALIITTWLCAAAWRFFSSRKASGKIVEAIGSDDSSAEKAILTSRVQKAIQTMKQLGHGGDYLYRRPWYVIIGPPAAGKTTALANSGLRLLADEETAPSPGGTRNIEFIFTDEAVLIDTAGRYTTQDSNVVRDRAAWRNLLELMRKCRPLQPINGIFIALPIDEIARSDQAVLDRHAQTIRERLFEIEDALSLKIPVYVLFTKCDLLAGFAEFFDDLDVEGRRSVLGSTLAWPSAARTSERDWARAYDELAESVETRMAKRLQDELDGRRRGLIIGFPGQVEALRSRIIYLLSRAFSSSDGQRDGFVRGFYLTSGVQLGTPLDRVIGSLAQVRDAPQAKGGHGRAYFINKLIKDVVVGEAGLVRRTSEVYARERLALIGGGAAILSLSVILIALWTISFVRNREFEDHLASSAVAAGEQLRQTGVNTAVASDVDVALGQVLPALDAIRALPGGYAERHGAGHSLFMTFGLYQSNLGESAELVYLDALRRILLPRIFFRMEETLREGSSNKQDVYDALKAYLILVGRSRSFDTATIREWTADDWQNGEFRGADHAPELSDAMSHLDALLADPDLGTVWSAYGGQAPYDDGLVNDARKSIESLSLAERAYAMLKQTAASQGVAWSPAQLLTEGARKAFRDGDQFAKISVPFLYTRGGYEQVYLAGFPAIEAQLRKDAWVLGPDQSKESTIGQLNSLQASVSGLYAAHYIKAWHDLLASMHPADYFTDESAYGAVIAKPSPIALVIRHVAANTNLSASSELEAHAYTAVSRFVPRASNVASMIQGAGGNFSDAAATITAAFQGLDEHAFDDYLTKLSAAIDKRGLTRSPLGGAPDADAQRDALKAAGDLALAAKKVPADLQSFASEASQEGTSATVSSGQSTLEQTYRDTIKQPCVQATDQRYPFAEKAAEDRDADLGSLNKVFGAGGSLDNFVNLPGGVGDYIDRTSPVWHWRNDAPVARGFNSGSPEQFQRAGDIQNLLGASGLEVTIEATQFGGDLTAAELTIGGNQPLRFESGQANRHEFRWSTNLQPEAHVALIAQQRTVNQIATQGTWALVRLFDAAQMSSHSSPEFDATFGDESEFVKFHVVVHGSQNPFGHPSHLWAFRCPASL